jgi:hypothetical protein
MAWGYVVYILLDKTASILMFYLLGLLVALFTLCNWLRPFYWVFDIYNFTYQKKKVEHDSVSLTM